MAPLKESEVNWNDIEQTQYECEIENFIFIYDEGNYKSSTFKFRYKLLTTKKDNSTWYRIEGELPYNFKSQWRNSKDKDWQKYALQVLNSSLKSKYKSILLRSYNYNILLQRTNVSPVDLHKIYNRFFYQKLDDLPVGKIYYDSENIAEPKYANTYNSEMNKIPNILTWRKFVEMMIQSNCHYCGINMFQINELRKKDHIFTKRFRGYSMEIDQINPYGHYTDNNCVPSCYWCNNAKTDEFTIDNNTYDEFKKYIAPGIRAVWNTRLDKAKLDLIPED